MKKMYSWTFAAAFTVMIVVLVSGCGGLLDPGLRNDAAGDGLNSDAAMVRFEVGVAAAGFEALSIGDDDAVMMVRIFGRHMTSHAVVGPYELMKEVDNVWRGSATDLPDGNYLFYVWAYDEDFGNPGVLYYGVTGVAVMIPTEGNVSVTIPTSTVASADIDPKSIGPAGGWIFYADVSPQGWGRYLEAAPVSTEFTSKQWGGSGIGTGVVATAIGTGEENTTAIGDFWDGWRQTRIDTPATPSGAYNYTDEVVQAELAAGKIPSRPEISDNPATWTWIDDWAAKLCGDLVQGVYDDWFLPSKDELDSMYNNLHISGAGGFVAGVYWSSSEGNSNCAWCQYFVDGGQYNNAGKFNALQVRAVRAF